MKHPTDWLGVSFNIVVSKIQKAEIAKLSLLSGASDVTRTRDLLITSEMHYRLCYTSEANNLA